MNDANNPRLAQALKTIQRWETERSERQSQALIRAQIDLARRLSANFTKRIIVRSYDEREIGHMETEAEVLIAVGYEVQAQTGLGSHVNVGRTVAPAVLTGGLSLLAGASRTNRTIVITYVLPATISLNDLKKLGATEDRAARPTSVISTIREWNAYTNAKQEWDEREGSIRRKWNPLIRAKYNNPTLYRALVTAIVALFFAFAAWLGLTLGAMSR